MTTHYIEPEPVYEIITQTKKLARLSKGDQLENNTRIGDVTVGHKYVTIKAQNGQQLWRELLETARDAEVEVRVRRQTDESRAVERRYDGNLEIMDKLEKFERDYEVSVANFQERWAEWGSLYYSFLDTLIEADAKRTLWRAFAANIDWHLEQGHDHVEAMTLYVEQLKDGLFKGHRIRGNSRSTNQLSNLMDDVANEYTVDFIQTARWFGVE